MTKILITTLLLTVAFNSAFSQNKIYFEEAQPTITLDVNDGALLNSEFIVMKNENEDTIEVAWLLSPDVPFEANPNNNDRLQSVWTVLVCDEILCHSEPQGITVIPPNETYKWKLSVTSNTDWLDEWVLGKGVISFEAANTKNQEEAATFEANLIVGNGTTSVDQTNFLAGSLYPNPSTGLINLEVADPLVEINQIVISDITGRQVNKLPITNLLGKQQIDYSNLSSGIYNLNLIDKQGTIRFSEKLIRQ